MNKKLCGKGSFIYALEDIKFFDTFFNNHPKKIFKCTEDQNEFEFFTTAVSVVMLSGFKIKIL